MDIKGHFKTITHHRHEVMKNCFRVGLYRQGLLHDLSKYSPTEFLRGIRYYQGNKSPNDAERRTTGVSLAWLHHKGRNKHHFEYWIDYDISGSDKGQMTGLKMPVRYVVEMACDRIAASKTYMKSDYTDASALEYFLKGKSHYMMHPSTMKMLENILTILKDEGEDKAFRYMRYLLRKDRRHTREAKRKKCCGACCGDKCKC